MRSWYLLVLSPWRHRSSVRISEPSPSLSRCTHCGAKISAMADISAQHISTPAFHNLNFLAFHMIHQHIWTCCHLPLECWQPLCWKHVGSTGPAGGMAVYMKREQAPPGGSSWLLVSLVSALSYSSSLDKTDQFYGVSTNHVYDTVKVFNTLTPTSFNVNIIWIG